MMIEDYILIEKELHLALSDLGVEAQERRPYSEMGLMELNALIVYRAT